MDQQSVERSKQTESENNGLIYECNECNDKFSSKINLEKHQIREHQQSITVLSDEVVEHILKFLHPNDLASLSETCRNYRQSAREYFQRKHQCGWVEIISERENPKFATLDKEKYEKVFRSIIRNIKINKGLNWPVVGMLNFIKNNCSKNILSLILSNFSDIELIGNHVDIIGEQIQHLERLTLDNDMIRNMQWNRFTNLRILYVKTYFGHVWQSQKFPKLHTLFLLNYNSDPDHLTRFFENNKQLETLSCYCQLKVLRSVLYSGIDLSNLHLSLPVYMENDEETLNAMEECYNQIELFDIAVDSLSILNGISQMEKVKRIHCYFREAICYTTTSNAFGRMRGMNIQAIDFQLPHIQWLHAYISVSRKEGLDAILKLFPNLSKLWINFRRRSEMSPNKIISILVDGLPKLQDLYLEDMVKFRGKKDNLRNWTSSRLSMENATTVTVHLDESKIFYYDLRGFKRNGLTIKTEKRSNIECKKCSDVIQSHLDYVTDFSN